jgi:hypothetical protein
MEENVSAIPEFVCWLDPGLHSGWATLFHGEHFDSGEGILPEIGELLEDYGRIYGDRMAIGWEQFIITPGGGRSSTAGPAIEVIGMARWIGYKYGCTMLKPVPSAMRTSVSTNVLKKLRWHCPGMDHANQAARHLGAWMLRENLFTKEQKTELFTESDCQTLLAD